MPGTTDERTAAHRVVVGYHGTDASQRALQQALGNHGRIVIVDARDAPEGRYVLALPAVIRITEHHVHGERHARRVGLAVHSDFVAEPVDEPQFAAIGGIEIATVHAIDDARQDE